MCNLINGCANIMLQGKLVIGKQLCLSN